MSREARRRFTLLDAMVLVAATAVGIALARGYLGAFGRTFFGTPPIYGLHRFWAAGASPCLTAWALALIGLRWPTPRRRRKRVIRQPGDAACMATAVGAASVAVLSSLTFYRMTNQGQQDVWAVMLAMNLSPSVAAAVSAVWLMILLDGRWRPRADWIDAAGRVLGIGWLLLLLASQLRWAV